MGDVGMGDVDGKPSPKQPLEEEESEREEEGSALHKSARPGGQMRLGQFLKLMHSLYQVLVSSYAEPSATRAITTEWEVARRGRLNLGRERFFDSLFGLFDLWESCLGEHECVVLLRQIYERISESVAVGGDPLGPSSLLNGGQVFAGGVGGRGATRRRSSSARVLKKSEGGCAFASDLFGGGAAAGADGACVSGGSRSSAGDDADAHVGYRARASLTIKSGCEQPAAARVIQAAVRANMGRREASRRQAAARCIHGMLMRSWRDRKHASALSARRRGVLDMLAAWRATAASKPLVQRCNRFVDCYWIPNAIHTSEPPEPGSPRRERPASPRPQPTSASYATVLAPVSPTRARRKEQSMALWGGASPRGGAPPPVGASPPGEKMEARPVLPLIWASATQETGRAAVRPPLPPPMWVELMYGEKATSINGRALEYETVSMQGRTGGGGTRLCEVEGGVGTIPSHGSAPRSARGSGSPTRRGGRSRHDGPPSRPRLDWNRQDTLLGRAAVSTYVSRMAFGTPYLSRAGL
jgi:hypothetical protein